MVVKLQNAGTGAPTREPAISEEEQKKMMAFYHKKQARSLPLSLAPRPAFYNRI